MQRTPKKKRDSKSSLRKASTINLRMKGVKTGEPKPLVYLDHSATSPLREEVLEAMVPFLREYQGNPNSTHISGRKAREAIEAARESVALLIGSKSEHIIFTSGGTETNNMVIRGCLVPATHRNQRIVFSAVEHPSVSESAAMLEKEFGVDARLVAVDVDGRLDLNDLEKAVIPETGLVSIMYVNNETGTLQPIAEVSELCRERGVPLHTDAVQAAGVIPLDVNQPKVEYMTLSAHKLGGPKGIGACYVHNLNSLQPLLYGGGQERGHRSGTENVPAIVGFGKVCEIVRSELESMQEETQKKLLYLEKLIIECFPDVKINGSRNLRAPHILNVSFPSVRGASVAALLDEKGICVSSGAACSSGSIKPSHVLLCMGYTKEEAFGGVRFSLGGTTTVTDIEYTVDVLKRSLKAIHQVRVV